MRAEPFAAPRVERRMPRACAPFVHTAGVLLLLVAGAPSQETPAGKADVAQWIARIEVSRKAAVDGLVAAMPESLQVLRQLLEHEDEDVAKVAAEAAEEIGPPAAALVPVLLKRLRASGSWWTQMNCGNALAAIGADDAEVFEALVKHCVESDVPRLRCECARAVQKLGGDACERLLAAVDLGRYEDPERAIETLTWLGEDVAEPLLAVVDGVGASKLVAREALARIGWRVVERLERAGHRELAQRALRTGPLQYISWVEEFVLEPTEPQPPVPQLPEITWETGYGHGGGLQLWRAAECATGLRFDVIGVSTRYDGGRKVANVSANSTVVPRARALAAMRQLALLAKMRLVAKPKPEGEFYSGSSSGNFHSRVLVRIRDDVVLDASFSGYPASGNVVERFPAEAARNVLNQLLADAEFSEREPNDEDRAAVDARCERIDGDAWWVKERLLTMRDTLRAK